MKRMEDIADALGVSRVTISRALNDHPCVAEETKRKVMDYVASVGYRPNAAARRLVQSSTDIIGVVCAHSGSLAVSSILTSVLDTLSHAGKKCQLLTTENLQQQSEAFTALTRREVDGLVVFSDFCDLNLLNKFLSANSAVVFIGPSPEKASRVECDNHAGMTQIMDHLFARGKRKLAFIGAPENLKREQDERAKAYLQSMATAGEKARMVHADDTDASSGYAAANRILSKNEPIDGLVCFSDELAFGALRAAHEHGIAVSDQLAITGFEGLELFQYSSPSLTSYKLPLKKMGEVTAELLIRKMQGEEHAGIEWLDGEIMIGSTS